MLLQSISGIYAYADSQVLADSVHKPVQATYSVSKEAVAKEVQRSLISQFNLEGELNLELLSLIPRVGTSNQPWAVEVVEYPTAMASIMQVRVRLLSAGRDSFEFPLNLRAQVWREVFVARDTIERESVFNPADLDVRRVDVLRERNSIPVSYADNMMVFRAQVQAGHALQWRDLQRRALVKKGDLIEVVASDGMLTVKMKGLALENGAAGEVITVRNIQSKRDITALVIAPNQAQVRF